MHPALFAGSVLPRTTATSEEGAAAGRAAAAVSSPGAIPVVMLLLLLLLLRLGACVARRSVADHVKSVGDGRLPGATPCLILAA